VAQYPANFIVRPQSTGVTHQNKDKGGPHQKGEAVTISASPASGVPNTGTITDFRAGSCNPASVLGTGDNADLKAYGQEAV
jgi:hypothetical protein